MLAKLFWGGDKLTKMLRDQKRIVRDFFGIKNIDFLDFWKKDFSYFLKVDFFQYFWLKKPKVLLNKSQILFND